MTWAATDALSIHPDSGEVDLVDDETRAALESAAEDEGVLVVRVAPPRPAVRGRLALVVEGAVEDALLRRGSAPPGVGASSDLDASLSDQLYRARLVGSEAMLLSLGSLEGIANLAGALDAEDSAVLRWWIAASRERPVRLMFDAKDRYLGIYAEPISLRRLIEPEPHEQTPASGEYRAPAAAPEVRASSSAMELSDAPPAVELFAPAEPPLAHDGDAEALARAMATLFDEHVESEDDREMDTIDFAALLRDNTVPAEEPAAAPGSEPIHAAGASSDVALAEEPIEVERALDTEVAPRQPQPDEIAAAAPSADVFDAATPSADAPATRVAESDSAASTGGMADGEAETTAAADARGETAAESAVRIDVQGCMRDLEAARGPKPLAVIERMFVSSYVPLSEAHARGEAPEAETVLSTWATSFDKSYSEAFDALRVRGKRPTMVLDIPDIALRMARLHGARSVQLVLVDGMRFDLGLRVNERLKRRVGPHAALTERLLMWSALPTTTETQLELLGRGAQGLREMTGSTPSEVPVARGRAAATLRRIRAGQRELYKLDIVESAVDVPGGPLVQRLDALADETADALAQHMLKQSPRTLVLVFADHGFRLEPMGAGTSAAHRGGASPEEVLVPAFAWLVGAVH
ncbi:MAG: hypothetical protein R3B13_30280 [Polyangiaceae bacterium]